MLKLIFFIWGTIVGSFLNVCIYRMPRSKSIVWPGSQCVNCGHFIKWYENIPLVSFVFLKGKCGSCKKKISVRYFLVELLTGILFTALYIKFGLTLNLLFFLIFMCGLIVATFIDFDYQLIPDTVSLGGLALGLAASFIHPSLFGVVSHKAALLNSFYGAAAGGISIYAVGILGKFLFRKDAMGCLLYTSDAADE